MRDVAAALVLPRGGALDLALSLVASPVTLLTLVVLGYGVLQTMRRRHAVNLRGARMLAVPTAAAFAAVVLFQNDAPVGVWIALLTSLVAWLARDACFGDDLKTKAMQAAQSTIFNNVPTAPLEQKGYIVIVF